MIVLDATAYLAFMRDESGADDVSSAIVGADVAISTVAVAEALGRLCIERPEVAEVLTNDLTRRVVVSRTIVTGGRTWPLIVPGLTVEPFLARDAAMAAVIAQQTRHLGLSFGGRCCLAFARRLVAVVLTADPALLEVPRSLTGVEVRLITD